MVGLEKAETLLLKTNCPPETRPVKVPVLVVTVMSLPGVGAPYLIDIGIEVGRGEQPGTDAVPGCDDPQLVSDDQGS